MQLRVLQHVMKRFSGAVAAIVILALALGAPRAAQAWDLNLITNGDFTSYVTGPTPSGGPSQIVNDAGTTTVAEGYTALTGWNSTASSSGAPYNFTFLYTGLGDSHGSYAPAFGTYTYLWGPANGSNNGLAMPPSGNYLAMDGTDNVKTPLYQNVTGLTVGQNYVLNFNWAAAEFYAYSGNTTEQYQVTLGSQTQYTPIYNNTPAGFSGWMNATMTFTATATSETLSFLSLGTPDSLPPCALLADVSMTAAPEPSSILIFSIGLIGIGVVRRLRKPASPSAD